MPNLGVIALETTGLNPFRQDRIVELAAVVMRHDGETLREFATLVNPERDPGATARHGITAGEIAGAPKFADILGHLVETLDGCVALAGHNIRFDLSFLICEFKRAGQDMPDCPLLCTMQMAGGGSLQSCCEDYQVPLAGQAQTALADARAAARLLAALLADAPRKLSEVGAWPPISWPPVPRAAVLPRRRDPSSHQAEAPTYLQHLLARAAGQAPPAADAGADYAYAAVLDRALEDRLINEAEGRELLEVASRWGLMSEQVMQIHHQYLERLIAAAWLDAVVTEAEQRDLRTVARLLGIDRETFQAMLEAAGRERLTAAQARQVRPGACSRNDLAGRRICFTGASRCRYRGQPISRATAMDLAAQNGIQVVEAVTKQLDYLVVPESQTIAGKIKRARQYGIKILPERNLWAALGLEVE